MSFKLLTTLLFCATISGGAVAQTAGTAYKFDFGPGKTAKGYVQVLPSAVYSAVAGYGFDMGSAPAGTDRGGKDALKGDFVSSTKPFYFSVNVPEGNYKITVTLGDARGATASTIKAESRRLMLENITTKPGEFVTKTFIVNIKDRNISTGGVVGLKDRELPKLDWDNKLTLEFDLSTALNALEIAKVDDQVTVYLAGNSTVVNQDDEPWASWGQMIPVFFKPGVAIANHAESGLSLGSFIGSRRLAKILSTMKAGDFVFVEFGHNDEKEKGAADGADKSYSDRLRTFATEVKAKGAQLIIVSPTARRSFGADGKINNSHVTNLGDYPAAARKVAAEVGVPFIDLTAHSTTMFETLGAEGSKKAFVIYPELKLNDNTHFNPYGAYELAKVIVQGIRDNKLSLTKYLADVPAFDPARPDPAEKFSWPPSPKASLVKPDGN